MNDNTLSNENPLNTYNLMVTQATEWLTVNRGDLAPSAVASIATTLGNIASAERWTPPSAGWDADAWTSDEHFGDEVPNLIMSVEQFMGSNDALTEFLGSVVNMMGWKVPQDSTEQLLAFHLNEPLIHKRRRI